MTQIPIALQLYTVRDEMQKDFAGTHRKVAEMGYRYVELAGFGPLSAREYKSLLDELGLKPVGSHVGIDELLGDGVGGIIETHKILGVPYIIIPWLAESRRQGKEGYAELAADMNQIGQMLRDDGITLGYHNHNFEFDQKIDGKPALSFLLEETDPNLVKAELDTYWVLFAGADPVEFLARYPGRFPLLHIKDMDKADRSFAPIGTGILPLDAIVRVAPAAGAKYLIVEQDVCKGPSLDAARTSLANLKAKGYA